MNHSIEFVKTLARAYVHEENVPTALSPLHWEQVLDTINKHRTILPVVVDTLGRGTGVPQTVMETLQREVRRHRVSYGRLQGELCRVIVLLERRGIEPVVLKGVALANTVYRQPSHRVFGDIDLLVTREQMRDTCDLLLGAGYTTGVVDRSAEYYARFHFHHIFQSPSGILVEVHWDLTGPSTPFRFDISGIRERARSIVIADQSILVPSDSDHLTITAVQAWDGGFSDIRRVLDAALLIRKGSLGEPLLLHRVENAGIQTPFWYLLQLSRTFFDISAPAALEEAVRPAKFLERSLFSIPSRRMMWIDPHNQEWGGYRLIRWLSSGTYRSILGYARRHCFPGLEEFMERGYSSNTRPPLISRLLWTVNGIISLAKMALYLGVCRVGSRNRGIWT